MVRMSFDCAGTSQYQGVPAVGRLYQETGEQHHCSVEVVPLARLVAVHIALCTSLIPLVTLPHNILVTRNDPTL